MTNMFEHFDAGARHVTTGAYWAALVACVLVAALVAVHGLWHLVRVLLGISTPRHRFGVHLVSLTALLGAGICLVHAVRTGSSGSLLGTGLVVGVAGGISHLAHRRFGVGAIHRTAAVLSLLVSMGGLTGVSALGATHGIPTGPPSFDLVRGAWG